MQNTVKTPEAWHHRKSFNFGKNCGIKFLRNLSKKVQLHCNRMTKDTKNKATINTTVR